MTKAKRYFEQAKDLPKPTTSQEDDSQLTYGPPQTAATSSEEKIRRTFPSKTGGSKGPKDQRDDPYPGEAPVEPVKVEKYTWGKEMELVGNIGVARGKL